MRYKRIILLVLFLAALLGLLEWSGMRANFNAEYIHRLLEENLWRGLAIYIVLFCIGNLLHIPGWIFLAAAVLALGKVWGGMVTYVAATLSCVITYFVIRLIGGDFLHEIRNRYARRILQILDSHPVSCISSLRVVFQTMPTINYALALSGVGFRPYLLGTLIGLPLPITLYCLFFDYLARVLHWQ